MGGRRHTLLMAAHCLLIAGGIAVSALTSEAAHWQPLPVFAALVVLSVGSDLLALQFRGLRLSGGLPSVVLAMFLLGPAPTVALAVISLAVSMLIDRPPPRYALSNLSTFIWYPLGGALLAHWVAPHVTGDPGTALLVLGVFITVNVVNFALIYGYVVLADGRDWWKGVRELFLPVMPAQAGIGLLTAGIFLFARHTGPSSIVAMAPVILVFQWLLRTAIAASERGEELQERNQQLASLQVGLISTMLKTLSLRDHMTARHSAAVARYSRAMAEELGMTEEEQELIHTAALFHDIGKFIFPDSILLADRRLTDEEFEIIRRHPVVGAELISEIEGYGPVAEIVRHHHERIDGRGYPDAVAGEDIPLGSRIIAVADTYDVLTARDTYRDPVSISEAFAELRRVAGTQLDSQLVELFVDLVTNRGVRFRHSTAADFEAELALETRVWDYALPKKEAA